MITEPLSCTDHDANVVAEQPVAGPIPNKKTQGKVPKKIHKAEREKLKRDQLNELFLELGHALEPDRQSNGKASILSDTTRILRELIVQLEFLRKENAALLTESHYVNAEKNELKDETTFLETEISKLQNELHDILQSDPTCHTHVTDPSTIAMPVTQPQSVAPLYIVPLHQDIQTFPEPERVPSPPKPTTQVKRPRARYPTPSDSWPLQILSRHRHSNGSSSSSNSGEDEGSDKA